MSWWDIDEENVMGDGPADVMRSALDDIAEARDRQGRPRPSLGELLGGFARALKALERSSVEATAAPQAFQKIYARLKSSPQPIYGAEEAADEQMVESFKQAFAHIEAQYRQRWERAPRRLELLEALTFILGYKPERFLSNAEGILILEIIAQ